MFESKSFEFFQTWLANEMIKQGKDLIGKNTNGNNAVLYREN